MAVITPMSARFEPPPWRCVLQDIKRLYIQRQYTQCAALASDLLETLHEPVHPVYKTYLYFYSAIAYEAMGRSAHTYSSTKLALLHSALDGFVTCQAVLPAAADDEDSSAADSMSERPSSAGSLASSVTDISEIMPLDDDPFLSNSTTRGNLCFNTQLRRATPSPRQVCTPSTSRLQPLKLLVGDLGEAAKTDRTRTPRPPPLPIKIVPCSVSYARRQRQITPIAVVAPSPDPALARYHATLCSLRAEIHTSIAAVHALIDEVTERQHARRASRTASFWSLRAVENSPLAETKTQRIARLRADGWTTVGLRAPQRGWKGAAYYQTYCTAALKELYLEGSPG